jgi:mono/diheme cytochrome c family protein
MSTRLAAETAHAAGAAVYQRWCVHCHSAQVSAPGSLRLAWNRNEAPRALDERDDLRVAHVRQVVRHGLLEMPPFRTTELSDAALDAVAAYLTRHARGTDR